MTDLEKERMKVLLEICGEREQARAAYFIDNPASKLTPIAFNEEWNWNSFVELRLARSVSEAAPTKPEEPRTSEGNPMKISEPEPWKPSYNMQWQTIAEAKAKDKWERKDCRK